MLDFNDLISRTWKITWTHKTLWTMGFLMMLASFLFLPIIFVPMFRLSSSGDPTRWLENPILWIAMGIGFLLLIIASYGIGSIIRPMLVVGALKAEQGADRLSFGGLFREGRTYFWRFLGLMILFAVIITLVSSVVSAIQIFGIFVTDVMGSQECKGNWKQKDEPADLETDLPVS